MTQKWSLKILSLIISKRIKYQEINLTKVVQVLYSDNYKTIKHLTWNN